MGVKKIPMYELCVNLTPNSASVVLENYAFVAEIGKGEVKAKKWLLLLFCLLSLSPPSAFRWEAPDAMTGL